MKTKYSSSCTNTRSTATSGQSALHSRLIRHVFTFLCSNVSNWLMKKIKSNCSNNHLKGKTTGAQAYSREREDATLRRHRLLELNWEKALLLLLLLLQQHAVSPVHSFLSLIFSFSFFLLSIRVAPANELFSASVRFQNSFFFSLLFSSRVMVRESRRESRQPPAAQQKRSPLTSLEKIS